MAVNQVNERGVRLTMPVPLYANPLVAGSPVVGPISGEPLMFGNPSTPSGGGASSHMIAGVAETSYTPPLGMGNINPDGISFHMEGVFLLPVIAEAGLSPSAGLAIAPGDPIFADDNGTYDPVTGCYHGFSLTCDSANGHFFGYCLDAVLAGVAATVRVKLKN
jgi:hypothetical protein